jgi:hypothetical protein
MLVTTYRWEHASEQTLEAMRDRCHEQGHEFVNCASAMFHVFQRCKWCGEIR